MEAYIPLLCLLVITILLSRRAVATPVVWTRGRVAAAAAAVLGALAVPIVVTAIILG